MQDVYTIAIAAAALVAVSVAGRAIGKRARSPEAPETGAQGGSAAAAGVHGGELIAVIAAAVSAASGMDAGSFRVVGVRPSPAPYGGDQVTHIGLNTPVWGHIERFNRGD